MSMAAPAASQDKVTAPYGSWKSPITADIVSGADKRLGGTAVDGDGRLIWLETRPTESGYNICVVLPCSLTVQFVNSNSVFPPCSGEGFL